MVTWRQGGMFWRGDYALLIFGFILAECKVYRDWGIGGDQGGDRGVFGE